VLVSRTLPISDVAAAPSLDALYRAHAPAAIRLALLLTGDRVLAEDLVQDAFVRVAARRDALRDPNAFGPYLTRAVANGVKSHFRHQQVVRKHAPVLRDATVSLPPDVDTREHLWQALQSLPERHRAAVVCRYYEGMSERETADALGCPAGTVKTWLARGLAQFREVIGDV
jgi:RNA polymerase sigma-70 factor (sigma-E family)